MKKFKLLTPVLAAVPAAVMPLTALANCSCSNLDYTGITKVIKQDTLDYFTQLCAKDSFRATWESEQVYTKIKSILADLNIEQVYEDDWSEEATRDFESEGEESPVVGKYSNMWYDIPASEGCENWPKIILSSYYDVSYDCDKEALDDIRQNGLKLKIDEENQTIQADGNKYACGFVDGIGVAVNLAFAKNHTKFNHGPIRLLFTADSGDSTPNYASGSDYLVDIQKTLGDDKKPFDTPFVINTDGYNQGNIFVSSAGIHKCQIEKKEWSSASIVDLSSETYKNNPYIYDIEVTGLSGGHSALDIDSGYANAIKLLFQIISTSMTGFRLISFKSADDASPYRIPSYAKARIVMPPIISGEQDITEQKVQTRIDNLVETYKISFPKDKEKIKVTKTRITPSGDVYALAETTSQSVCAFGNAIPYGGRAWYDEEEKQVKTSVNIAPFNVTIENDANHTVTLDGCITCRSGSSDHLDIFSGEIHNYIQTLLGIKHKAGLTDYTTPVWENTKDSHKQQNAMSALMQDAYRRFRYTPSEVNCHGWLEGACYPAIIQTLQPKTLEETIPYIAAIGPTVTNPQTKDEKLYASTLNSMIRVMIYVLFNAQALQGKW